MSERVESLSSTARGSVVTTVTNSLSSAYSSPGLVLTADQYSSSTPVCETITRPAEILTNDNSLQLETCLPSSNSLTLPPPQPVSDPVPELIGRPRPTSWIQSPQTCDLIRQLLIRNLRAQKLYQQQQQQQQHLVAQTNLAIQASPPSQTVHEGSSLQQIVTSPTAHVVQHTSPSTHTVQQVSSTLQALQQACSPSQIAQQEVFSPQQALRQQQQQNLLIQKQLKLLQTLKLRQQQQSLQKQLNANHTGNQTAPCNTAAPSLLQRVEEPSYPGESSPVVIRPMTLSKLGARERPMDFTENMEYRYTLSTHDIPAFVTTCGDLPLSTDFIDASIYASSPNSLHLYEQEKLDMQSTLGINTSCTSVEQGSSSDDFDLKAQYEVSQDIGSFPLAELSPVVSHMSSMKPSLGEISWSDNLKPSQHDVYIKTESPGAQAPTLAELNMNLLDDIESFINFEMNVNSNCGYSDTKVKQEPGTANDETLDLLVQTGAGGVHRSSTSVQYPVAGAIVKTEPLEVPQPCSGKHQLSFTPMMVVKPDLIVPQGRTVESKAPLTTIKEIDISDFATLQKLLAPSAPLQVKGARKRAVSESQTMQRPVSRKRSLGATGLESMDRKWEEIKQFLQMETQNSGEVSVSMAIPNSPPAKRERTRYDSTSSVMTLTSNEDEDSDSDKDFDDDSDSDFEGGHDIGTLNPSESLIGAKEKQYFWQYNVQSKGPKGTRVKFDLEEDPHVLNDFEDPVFGGPSNSSNLSNAGVCIKHGGKARKGDGNDIVPSPKKLCQIGLQLRKINRQINDFVPVSELPSQARSKSRKEKNKLASRACRLKKKAQHEANKVKLHGLEAEHRRLLTVIHIIRQRLYERLNNKLAENSQSMSQILESLIKENLGEMIAGNTTEFVNSVIHKVEAGDTTGGISLHATRSYPKELHN